LTEVVKNLFLNDLEGGQVDSRDRSWNSRRF
jgi:hypothetical protein